MARNLAFSTIDGREKVVQAFARHVDAFRWNWTPQLVDEWFGDLRVPADRGWSAVELPSDRPDRVPSPQQVSDVHAFVLGQEPGREQLTRKSYAGERGQPQWRHSQEPDLG